MTQHELIIEYVKEFGFIKPAIMGGVIYKGIMLGSETTKRCRELRDSNNPSNTYHKKILNDYRDGKFTCFTLVEATTSPKTAPRRTEQPQVAQSTEQPKLFISIQETILKEELNKLI